MDLPKVLIYLSVVSWESVQIALFVAGLNNLEVENAYLRMAFTEKCYIVAGDKFGPADLKGRVIKIVSKGFVQALVSYSSFPQI